MASGARGTVADGAGGETVAAFLDHLSRHAFSIGLRESLDAQALMLQFAASGATPASMKERLALLRPLLSRTPDQQRRFTELLDRWSPPAGGDLDVDGPGVDDIRIRVRRRWKRNAAIVAALLVAAIVAWRWSTPPAPVDAPPSIDATTSTVTEPETAPAGADPVADAIGPLPLDASNVAREIAARRWLNAAGIVAGLLLIATLIGYALRRVALQPLRTDALLDQRTLFGERAELIPSVRPILRIVSRELRRARHTGRLDLDIDRTIAATLREGGAFTARYQPRRGTPEYVVLIEYAGRHDHLFRAALEIVAALERQGVAVDAYRFGSDPTRCTPLRLARHDRPGAPARRSVRFGELATRAADQRLLVFGTCERWLDPLHGGWHDGLQGVSAFAAIALFTPIPVPSWGAAETWLGRQGVLVLPLQLLALASAADWLTSQRALLTLDPSWPTTYPPRLRSDPLLWVARQTAPSPDEIDGLLFELELFLGPRRLQCLCACTVFPVPSWPITLAMVRLLGEPGVDPIVDVVALASLPWFREGTWPDWLREVLQSRLVPGHRARVGAELHRRLDAASLGKPPAGAEALTDVAVLPTWRTRLQQAWRRFATDRWLARGPGRLRRDVLFLGFVQRGVLPRLMLRIPEGLRRLLFREGVPLLGVRMWMVAAAVVPLVAALVVQVPVVRAWTEARLGIDALPTVPLAVEFVEARESDVRKVAFSQNGLWVAAASSDGRLWIWNRDGTLAFRDDLKIEPSRLSFGATGDLLFASASTGRMKIVRRQGTVQELANAGFVDAVFWKSGLLVVNSGGTVSIDTLAKLSSGQPTGTGTRIGAGQRIVKLVPSPDGRSILGIGDDGVQLDTVGPRPAQVRGLRSQLLVDGDVDNDGHAVVRSTRPWASSWDSRTPAQSVELGGATIALLHPAGLGPIVIAEGGDVRLLGPDGTRLAALPASEADIAAMAFSPNGRQFVTTTLHGAIRLWGERLPMTATGGWLTTASTPVTPSTVPPKTTPSKPTPDFLGQDIATVHAEPLGVTLGNKTDPSGDFCPGTVVAQAPAAGQPLVAGSTLEITTVRNKTPFYPLVCRGGMSPVLETAAARSGFRHLEFDLAPGTAPARQGLKPGQCAWVDRAFRPGEPGHLQMDLGAGQARVVRSLLGNQAAYIGIAAVNQGKSFRGGCANQVRSNVDTTMVTAPKSSDASQSGSAPLPDAPEMAPSTVVPAQDDATAAAADNAVINYFGPLRAPSAMQQDTDGARALARAFLVRTKMANEPALALALALIKRNGGHYGARDEAESKANTIEGQAPYSAYEPPSRLAVALGNTTAGDGALFHGRGPLQITGRAAYARFGALIGQGPQFLERPELVSQTDAVNQILVAWILEQTRGTEIDSVTAMRLMTTFAGGSSPPTDRNSYRAGLAPYLDAVPVAKILLEDARTSDGRKPTATRN